MEDNFKEFGFYDLVEFLKEYQPLRQELSNKILAGKTYTGLKEFTDSFVGRKVKVIGFFNEFWVTDDKKEYIKFIFHSENYWYGPTSKEWQESFDYEYYQEFKSIRRFYYIEISNEDFISEMKASGIEKGYVVELNGLIQDISDFSLTLDIQNWEVIKNPSTNNEGGCGQTAIFFLFFFLIIVGVMLLN